MSRTAPAPASVRLAPHSEVSRPLSAFEYFHASVGAHPRTLGGAREIVYLVEGAGQLPEARWREALAAVVAANPACRLRIAGTRRAARFESDGAAMPLRVVPNCRWDGMGHAGAEFLRATPLSLADGPMSELLVLESPPGEPARTRLAVRANHAAMDGLGMSHVLHELFRALRGEPLLGSNAPFSDADLMRHVGATRSTSRPIRCATLTGAPRGDDPAIWWRRISARGQRPNSMNRLVTAFAGLAREHETKLPVLFSLPVNLRRHLPGIHTAQNFGNMLFVPLYPGEDAKDFKRKLNALLAERMEAVFAPAFDLIRLLPMPWVDWLTQRRPGNFRGKRPVETVMISHLGYARSAALSCDGYSAEGVYGVPGSTGVFCTVFATEKQLDVIFGLPAVYGGEGRFERAIERLEQALEV